MNTDLSKSNVTVGFVHHPLGNQMASTPLTETLNTLREVFYTERNLHTRLHDLLFALKDYRTESTLEDPSEDPVFSTVAEYCLAALKDVESKSLQSLTPFFRAVAVAQHMRWSGVSEALRIALSARVGVHLSPLRAHIYAAACAMYSPDMDGLGQYFCSVLGSNHVTSDRRLGFQWLHKQGDPSNAWAYLMVMYADQKILRVSRTLPQETMLYRTRPNLTDSKALDTARDLWHFALQDRSLVDCIGEFWGLDPNRTGAHRRPIAI